MDALERAAGRAAAQRFFLAWSLARSGRSAVALAQRLGCSVDRLTRLARCRGDHRITGVVREGERGKGVAQRVWAKVAA